MNSREQRQGGSDRALAEEIEETSRLLLEDGEWDPLGDEPGPSHEPRGLRYTIRKKSERTYAKNAAVDRTYPVHIHEDYGANVSETSVKVYIGCLKTSLTRLAAI